MFVLKNNEELHSLSLMAEDVPREIVAVTGGVTARVVSSDSFRLPLPKQLSSNEA